MPSRDQATTSWEIDHDEIARRAYEIFCERGGEHGHDLDAVRRQRAGRALQRKPAFKFRLFCGREAKERGILREEVD